MGRIESIDENRTTVDFYHALEAKDERGLSAVEC